MRVMKKNILLFFLISIALSGCALNYVEEPPVGDPQHGHSIYVVTQVCLPSPPNRAIIGFYTVQSYGPGGRLRSAGGGGLSRTWVTTAGQPVFEEYTTRPIDLKAVIIGIEKSDFVFLPPQKMPDSGWSAGMCPDSQNVRDVEASKTVSYRMVYGKDFEHIPPEVNAPKIRYRVVRLSDYLYPAEQKRKGIIAAIPSC